MNSSGFAQFIPLILIFVIFYFFLIRPQQKRVKDHRAMVQGLKWGDEVITSGFNHNNNFFPSGIHIGYVEKIYIDDSGLFQHAEIIPRATGGLLDFLFIADEGKN